ncbi:MAG: hypothetical protein U9N12_09695 [Euryarchaeota archaeon]|nr:hypothetical protein [Euryarchaeota archaeon]
MAKKRLTAEDAEDRRWVVVSLFRPYALSVVFRIVPENNKKCQVASIKSGPESTRKIPPNNTPERMMKLSYPYKPQFNQLVGA